MFVCEVKMFLCEQVKLGIQEIVGPVVYWLYLIKIGATSKKSGIRDTCYVFLRPFLRMEVSLPFLAPIKTILVIHFRCPSKFVNETLCQTLY